MRSTELAESLRAYIADGGFGPGDRLPAERELIKVLGGSRGTMRRAMDRLRDDGVLWRGVGQGTFVGRRTDGRTADAAPFAHQPSARPTAALNTTNPAEVLEARSVLEPRITAIAALRATPDDIERMDEAISQSERASSLLQFEHWDSAFHGIVATACNNSMLLTLFETLNQARSDSMWGRLKQASLTPERISAYILQHRAVRDAIADRDRTAAEAAMRDHLRVVAANMLGES